MFGYCEIGSCSIASAPMSVIRIAMTIATIGRRMKNLDIRTGAAVAGVGDPGRWIGLEAESRGHRPRLQQRARNVRPCLTSRRSGRRRRGSPRLRIHEPAFASFLDPFDDN